MTEELSAFEDETELPSQIIDCNMDGELDKFTFLINLEAMETKTIFFKETKNKEQRTKNKEQRTKNKKKFGIVF